MRFKRFQATPKDLKRKKYIHKYILVPYAHAVC